MTDAVHDTFIDGLTLSYAASRTLVREKSAHQELVLIENERFGRVLLLDGATQVTTADEFIYHEMLAHVPIIAHGDVQEVLIIGGGDGGLAEEVLKHKGIRRVVQVELDATVVEASRRFLGEINHGIFDDDRFQLHIGEGRAFIADLDERFDVVLVDSTDPVGAATKLFTPSFYRAVRRSLRVGGVLVAQAGAPFVQPTEFTSTMRSLASTFKFASCYLLASPSYFGGHLALAWASEGLSPMMNTLEELRVRHANAALKLRYYTPEVAAAAFALPAYIKEMVDDATRECLTQGD
jgi:spermidine synthase